MINLASQDDSLFKAGASCHPAMVDPEDAAKLTIPFAILPSKDEDDKTVEEWKKRAAQPVVVEKFPDQVHGFMAARYVSPSVSSYLPLLVCRS